MKQIPSVSVFECRQHLFHQIHDLGIGHGFGALEKLPQGFPVVIGHDQVTRAMRVNEIRDLDDVLVIQAMEAPCLLQKGLDALGMHLSVVLAPGHDAHGVGGSRRDLAREKFLYCDPRLEGTVVRPVYDSETPVPQYAFDRVTIVDNESCRECDIETLVDFHCRERGFRLCVSLRRLSKHIPAHQRPTSLGSEWFTASS